MTRESQAAGVIVDCVQELQLHYPDALAIVLRELNQCPVESALPGFEQYEPGKKIL